jgi:DNA-binding HxlR family transcriptional regulator
LQDSESPWADANLLRCPINNTFRIIGKKFTVLILRNMMHLGHTRFSQLLDSIEEINSKTLSARLKEMESEGLVERKVYSESPVRIEYTLTQKGRALRPVLEQMALFSMQYYAGEIFADGKQRKLREVFGRN